MGSKKRGTQHLKRNAPSDRRAPPASRADPERVNFYEMALTVDHDGADEVLRVPAEPVVEITPEIFELCARMLWVNKHDPDCLGIAAPQIGVHSRIFTVKDNGGMVYCFVNPEVTRKSGAPTVEEYEGCYSLPGWKARVKRATAVQVSGMAPSGDRMEMSFVGRAARAVQHEMDHLDGVLISDHSPLVLVNARVEHEHTLRPSEAAND